ncbi:MAG TPA: ABC transporter permease [Longimicrobiaceae bacterium]
MSAITRLSAVTLMFLRPALRQPVLTLLVSMLPISFILIFGIIGGAQLSRHALFGSLIVFAANVGIVSMPQLAVSFRDRSLQDMFVSSPVSPLLYASGMGLSRLAWVAPGLAIILAILVATGGMPAAGIPGVVLVVLVTWFTGTMIGFTVAAAAETPQMVGVVANMLGMLLSVLPPIYYPLELVPASWRWLPMILPTTHAAQLVRVAGGLAETTPLMLAVHWTVLLGIAAACAVVTVTRAQWRRP